MSKLAINIYGGSIVLVVILIGQFFIQRGASELRHMEAGLYENPLSGRIKAYKSVGKGMCEYKIEESGKDTVVTFFNFRHYTDSLVINDSIYKPAHSHKASFYRKSGSGNYEISHVIELP